MAGDADRIELLYFDVVGRAQPLRGALADAGVAFDDRRVSMQEWPSLRESTPFAGLPVLRWAEDVVAETLPIGSYVARRRGDYEGRSPSEIAALEAVSSCAYLEVSLRLGELVWADVLYPGADPVLALPRIMPRVLDRMRRLDTRLGDTQLGDTQLGDTRLGDTQLGDSHYFGGTSPAVADFFVYEASQALRTIVGDERALALSDGLPRLREHTARMNERPSMAAPPAERPSQLSSRPDEPAIVERLRKAARSL